MLLMLHAATYARLHNACSVAEHAYIQGMEIYANYRCIFMHYEYICKLWMHIYAICIYLHVLHIFCIYIFVHIFTYANEIYICKNIFHII